MLLSELHIVQAGEDVKTRKEIYRVWHLFITEDEVNDRRLWPFYYSKMKYEYGMGLAPGMEVELMKVARKFPQSIISSSEIEKNEELGVFKTLNPDYTRAFAVIWGKLACDAVFKRYGIDSRRIREDLGIHIMDQKEEEDEGKLKEVVEALKMGMTFQSVAEHCEISVGKVVAIVNSIIR